MSQFYLMLLSVVWWGCTLLSFIVLTSLMVPALKAIAKRLENRLDGEEPSGRGTEWVPLSRGGLAGPLVLKLWFMSIVLWLSLEVCRVECLKNLYQSL